MRTFFVVERAFSARFCSLLFDTPTVRVDVPEDAVFAEVRFDVARAVSESTPNAV